jgi:glutamine cyclotransferase
LIVTDGSNKLFYLDPVSLKVLQTVTIYNSKKKEYQLSDLNELEYIDGYIYANVWLKNYIVIIDPDSGEIVKYLDLSKIIALESTNNREHVLNGIAYDKESKK